MNLVSQTNRNSHRDRVTAERRCASKAVEATVKAALIAILSVSILLPSAAQQTAPSQQAAQLLRSALGVLSPSMAPRDIALSGTAHYIAGSDDETGTVVIKALFGSGSRIDLSLSSGVRSEINNSASGIPVGKWSGPDGVSHNISIQNLLTEPAWFFPTFLVVRGLSPSGYTVTYVGHESLNDQAVEHLSISQSFPLLSSGAPNLVHLTQTNLFLDSGTMLPAAMTFNIHPDNNALVDIPIEVRFSDYRPVNGLQIPFHVQRFLNNGLVLDLQFQDAAINSGVSATEFEIQ
jgi:hypothetical protein